MKRRVGTGIILVNSKRHILLLLRDDKTTIPFPNTWDLPGGHIEGNESPEQCVRREMREELELELGTISLFKQYVWPEFDEYIFWKELDLDLPTIHLHEGQRLQYFSIDDINKMRMAFHYNEVLPQFCSVFKSTKG